MIVYVCTACALLIYLVAAWVLGSLLGLQGRDLWIFRGGLALIGCVASAAVVWFYIKTSKQKAGALSPGLKGSEIDVLIREANAGLKSCNLGRRPNLKKLPVVFVLGNSKTGKTSNVVQSGLEAKLLAGQVYEGSSIVPVHTRLANFWYARNTVFVEVNDTAVADTAWWSRLLRRLQPGKLSALKGGLPPRAAIVCFSCETFWQSSGTGTLEQVAIAVRNIRTCLEEVSRASGISFSVYVLFTKADLIPFFTDFARNLTDDEAAQVLGVTLPLRTGEDIGVYAEQENHRLTAAFHNLLLSLAGKRPDLLSREHDSQKLGAIYEFPRELRKLQSPSVHFLVDLCRPSHLKATPFLRGFYFSGVRPVMVTEIVRPAETPQHAAGTSMNPQTGATEMFKFGGGSAAAGAIPQPQVVRSRKVARWTFLTHFFSDVLLQDRLAVAAAGASVKTTALRRVLLIAGAALCLALSLGFIVSYFGNRALETEIADAARGISTAQPSSSGVPLSSTLAKLDALRQSLEKLSLYRRDGPPWRLGWGLYAGADLNSPARSLYFKRFHDLLFESTQTAVVDLLKKVPPTPAPGDDYGFAYDTLKAYLITTSNHDKSSQTFLSPVLWKRWSAGRSVDAETLALAQKQFDFYSEELKAENPFSSENDALAVERSRRYLSQFAGAERVYQIMLAEASSKSPAVNFNRKFPGSAEVVVDNREISGAYTKAGWTFIQDAIKNPDRFFSGEQWVLGDQGASGMDRAKLEQQLRDRYTTDFMGQWQQFLRAASVVRFTSVKDAAAKLNKLSSNQSPLLALFCVVSENTAVDTPQIKTAFQPVQLLTPPPCAERYIGESNAGYMQSVVGLGALLEQFSPGGPNEGPLTEQIMSSTLQAKVVTRQLAQKFQIDVQNHLESVVQKLMEDPITSVESLIRNVGPAELNAKGKTFCSQFSELATKYPFNSNATRQASVQELNAVFQPPQGAFWSFYEMNLRNHIARQPGGPFAAKSGGAVMINPEFLNFWNRAAAFADALYPEGSAQPRLVYTLRPHKVEGIETSLSVDGQTITTTGASAAGQFVWSGNPNSVLKLTGRLGPGTDLDFGTYEGLWAPFQFFADADKSTQTPTGYALEWVQRQGRGARPITLPNGMPLTIRFDLEGKTAFVFQKNSLSGFRCVSEIAR